MWTDSASKSARVLAVAACLSAASNDAFVHAAEPSATRGRELAVRLCSNCHVVSGAATAAVPEGSGTFRGIANSPGQSAERISNVLILPHLPMPDHQLTREEIQDILAYLETLRTNPEVPPLITPLGTKPQTPSKT